MMKEYAIADMIYIAEISEMSFEPTLFNFNLYETKIRLKFELNS
jgi:hypothetical protein